MFFVTLQLCLGYNHDEICRSDKACQVQESGAKVDVEGTLGTQEQRK